jgi:CheY-like chemotaxis protein
MTQPLALVLYEKLLPGTQLVNRLQDLGYRVQTVGNPASLLETATSAMPMLVIADLQSSKNDVLPVVTRLRQNQATSHVPVLGFVQHETEENRKAAIDAGVTVFATDAAVVNHLPLLLEQTLRVD